MPDRPNILYLVHRVPYPPNRGDRIRSYHLLRFLADRYRVFLGCLSDEPVDAETPDQLRQWCTEVAIVQVGLSRWCRAALKLAAGGSLTEGLFYSPRLMQVVCDWSSRVKFDASVVFCSSMATYLSTPHLDGV